MPEPDPTKNPVYESDIGYLHANPKNKFPVLTTDDIFFWAFRPAMRFMCEGSAAVMSNWPRVKCYGKKSGFDELASAIIHLEFDTRKYKTELALIHPAAYKRRKVEFDERAHKLVLRRADIISGIISATQDMAPDIVSSTSEFNCADAQLAQQWLSRQ